MRRHNADGAMEYWLESADLMDIRKEAGVQDPYWTPPPGWKLGDNPTQDPVCARELKELREEIVKLKEYGPTFFLLFYHSVANMFFSLRSDLFSAGIGLYMLHMIRIAFIFERLKRGMLETKKTEEDLALVTTPNFSVASQNLVHDTTMLLPLKVDTKP